MAARDPLPVPGFGAPVSRAASDLIGRIARDAFTDVTGNGFAIGRFLGAGLFGIGLILIPMGVVIFLTLQPVKPAVAEWVELLDSLGPYFAWTSAAVVTLITLTAPVDPGGAWWSKKNAPPPVAPTGAADAGADPAPRVEA